MARLPNRRILRWCITAAMGAVAIVGATVPAGAADQVWTVVPTPGLGPGTRVESVDCVGAAWCVAVGTSGQGSGLRSLIAMGDGATWSVVSSTDPLVISALGGVSCASPASCFAVGFDSLTFGTGANRIERWDGTAWTVVPSPQVDLGPTPGFGEGQALKAVSCVGPSWCAAVGEHGSYLGNTMSFSFLVWDGTTWTITAEPLVAGSKERPSGISCISATSCVAVGRRETGSRSSGVLWRWDGSTWTRDAMPDVGLPDSTLQGVSCVVATWCSAVGIRYDGPVPGRTLNVVWDGTAWSVVPTPNLDDQYNYLKGISCATTTSCTAVGDHFGRIGADGSNGFENLIMFWDGVEWSVVPNPPTVGPTADVQRVSACAGGACPSDRPEDADARSWFAGATDKDGPDPIRVSAGAWANRLYGVSCFSTSACRATGTAEDGTTPQGFVLAWDGAVASPVPRFTG